MARFLALFAVVACFHSQRISSQDFLTNLEGLNIIDLINIEEQLLHSINKYISDREETLDELENVLNQPSAPADSQSTEEYLANPLNQYLVIKRFSENWGKFSEFLYSDSSVDELLSMITKFKKRIPDKGKLHKVLRDIEMSRAIDPDPEGHRLVLETAQ